MCEEDAEDKIRWRWMIRCGDPKKEQPKGKDEEIRMMDWQYQINESRCIVLMWVAV